MEIAHLKKCCPILSTGPGLNEIQVVSRESSLSGINCASYLKHHWLLRENFRTGLPLSPDTWEFCMQEWECKLGEFVPPKHFSGPELMEGAASPSWRRANLPSSTLSVLIQFQNTLDAYESHASAAHPMKFLLEFSVSWISFSPIYSVNSVNVVHQLVPTLLSNSLLFKLRQLTDSVFLD